MLYLRGEPVRLERRPFELLVLLVSRHGLLVTRDEIIARLWPGNVVIDFDTGLNTLVRKVRHALGDSPDGPAYIETVAGLGYRFVAPVMQQEVTPTMSPGATGPESVAPGHARNRGRRVWIAAAVATLVAVGLSVGIWRAYDRAPLRKSIAVLPFENLTGNVELEYLAAGLAEETSATLAQIDLTNVRLIGRVSSEAFAASNRPVSQIGRDLGVDFIVTSSLRAEKSRIRVTSRLVRVSDDEQMWTASFDREMTSLLGLERELSSAIAEQVRMRLSPEIEAAMVRRQTHNPEAYNLYLQGRYHWSQLTQAGSRRALELYESAIRKDPGYALAWAGMAQVLSTGPITGDADPTFLIARARDAVRRAVRFGPDLSESQYVLGHFKLIMDWDWPTAEQALRKSIAIDPNNALAHLFLGHVLSQSGQPVEAREMVGRARELDPLFSHTFALSSQVAFQARDYPAALELARQAVAINPEGWVGHLQLGQTLAAVGKLDDALAAYDSAVRHSGGNSKAVGYRAHLLAQSGHADEARAVIAELQLQAQERYVPPYAIAMIHAGLAENELALDWLERAFTVRDVHLFFLPMDPRWDALRNHPRFRSLVEQCGFCGKSGVLTAGRCQATEPLPASSLDETAELDDVPTRTETVSANIDGIWTANAAVVAGQETVRGRSEFSGPAGRTRQMGMCLVERYATESGDVACETTDDCGSAPADLAEGGSRYCVAPAGKGPKFCHYRPGPRAGYCAGSPALNYARITPGAYQVEIAAAPGTRWLTLTCFNACDAIPPAISESATVR